MVNKKALGLFLALTFGSTITLIIVARLMGFTLFGAPVLMSQVAILVAMFMPAVSAIIVQKMFLKKSLRELGFKFGPWSMYAKTYGLIVMVFAINYAITWALVVRPDWTLISFLSQFGSLAPTLTLPLPAAGIIAILAGVTFMVAPILNMIPSLGEEIGWRGFLLPNLEPLGKIKAMVISGMIWALWHTPMIILLGFTYGHQVWPGVILHFLTVTGIGIWMGYVWFKTRSTILAGFMHAVFNANAYGVWTVVFVSSNKLIIGGAGLIGAALCTALGVITIYYSRHKNEFAY